MTKLFFAAALAASLHAGVAAAQDYPTRPITIIVPFAAGGPTDTSARQLVPGLTAHLGQSIVIEDVSGGSSTIGTARVAKAAPDGYTLLFHNLAISANVSLYPHLTFDPEKDLVPVGFVNNNALVLLGRKSLPANTLAELIPAMKREPLQTAYPGPGTTGHLATALFAQLIGANVNYIPYRGSAPAMQDLFAEHVDLFFATVQAAVEPVRSGIVKAYGITAKDPLPELPGVPSFVKELGPKMEILFWQALFAPAGTPKPVLDKLTAALNATMADPKLIKAWNDTGMQAYPPEQRTGEAAANLLRSEIERWREVIRDNKIEGSQ